jgi:DinB superfamily
MHPRIQEVLSYLDARREDLRQAIDAVPAGRRETRPAADRWSAAEVVEHLAMVEGRMARGIFARRIDEARANGVGMERETTSVAASFNADGIVDRRTPRTAPEPVVPLGGKDAETAWTELQQVRAGLRATLTAADGLALGDVRHAHPTLGDMNLYQWALWIGAHEARHAAQIREIAAQLDGLPVSGRG